MTSEERFQFTRITAINAEVVYAEKRKMEEATLIVKTDAIKKALERGKLTIEEIAEDNAVSLEFVIEIKNRISQKK